VRRVRTGQFGTRRSYVAGSCRQALRVGVFSSTPSGAGFGAPMHPCDPPRALLPASIRALSLAYARLCRLCSRSRAASPDPSTRIPVLLWSRCPPFARFAGADKHGDTLLVDVIDDISETGAVGRSSQPRQRWVAAERAVRSGGGRHPSRFRHGRHSTLTFASAQ